MPAIFQKKKVGNDSFLQGSTILVPQGSRFQPFFFVEKRLPMGAKMVPLLMEGHRLQPFLKGHHFFPKHDY